MPTRTLQVCDGENVVFAWHLSLSLSLSHEKLIDERHTHTGCRHAPGRRRILDCPDTWATRLVGGMHAIEKVIVEMETRADSSSKPTTRTSTQVDMPNHDLTDHSTILFCELCMQSSVVCFENYRNVMAKVMGDGMDGWMERTMGIYKPMESPQVRTQSWVCVFPPVRTRIHDMCRTRHTCQSPQSPPSPQSPQYAFPPVRTRIHDMCRTRHTCHTRHTHTGVLSSCGDDKRAFENAPLC